MYKNFKKSIVGALTLIKLLLGHKMKIKTVTKNLLSLAIIALLCGNVAAQDNKLVFEEKGHARAN